MADNFTVLNSASQTVTFRSTDVGGGIEGNMSIPMNTSGTARIDGSIARVVSTAGAPAAVAVKGSAGSIMSVNLYCNATAAPVFLKIYNVTAAGVSVGTTVPTWTVGVTPGAPRDCALPLWGALGGSGISYAITGSIADTDTTAVAINDINGIIVWL